ncbi:MAG: histidine--tRNA ligase [Myxococcota bacterium]|nr:histidine--tRNA ligase [Myxococcota bacterium]
MSKQGLQAPRGTRDFYPEDLRFREWLFGHFRAVAKSFGYEEVDAPIVEHAELFTRKAGEEIVDQLYHFTLHDRHLALRGEFTPSLARMVMARQGGLAFPIRWFSIPQCWRYERMTRGRRREHYQWNMDVWGEAGVEAEAELLAAICALFDRLELPRDCVKIRLNSRALLEESLRDEVLRDRPEAFEPLCVVIDKLDKIGADSVVEQLTASEGPVGLDEAAARRVIEMLGARDLDEAAVFAPPDSKALADLRRLFELLDAYGIGDRALFDASVVRGLAYYTGVVFEAFDTSGARRAICGGGRYDRLLETLGGKSLPAVGFGFGDAVIHELLIEQNLVPELPRNLDDVVYAFSEAERATAVDVAQRLRAGGRSVELVHGHPKLKRVFADADKNGASRVWVLGPDEVAAGKVSVKELESGEQRDVPLGQELA